jgi:hypothetical protein
MKILRNILLVLAALLILITVLIVTCAYNPGLTAELQRLIYRGKTVEVSSVSNNAASSRGEESGVSGNTAKAPAARMRSLAELGLSEDDMITSLEDYYRNCHDQIVERGVGTYSFENVIATEALVQEIYAKYSDKEYVDGYMNETLNEVGAASYEMNLMVEELEGKHFRLTHQLVLNEG